MSFEHNKHVVRDLLEAFNAREFDHLIGTILSPDLVYEHNGRVADAQRWVQDSRECVVSFPDARVTIEEQHSAGDEVVTHLRFQGTHTGLLGQLPPTGKSFTVIAKNRSRIANGLIVEHREEVDEADLLRQLGVDLAVVNA